MEMENAPKQRKRPMIKMIAFSFLAIIVIVGILLYTNFNRLLSDALLRSFNSNIISDVYELKFEKLLANPFEGTIRVFNVTLQPREKSLNSYPYINSSLRLKTEKLTLKKVDLFALLQSSILKLERISITKPDIDLMLAGDKHILLPFKDSTALESKGVKTQKRSIDSFRLNEFQLIDASVHTTNSGKQREFRISEFNISLYDLLIKQRTGKDLISFNKVDLSLGEFKGNLQKGPIKHLAFKDFKIGVDSLDFQMTRDTMIFHFRDFNTSLNALDIQTADSVFHLTLQSFNLSYQNKEIKLNELSFKPNVSQAALQKKYSYQHAEVSGTIGSLNLHHVNFDSMIYERKIFIDEIVLDKVTASIFKDKTKPINKNRVPDYLGQTMKTISLPILIKQLKATNVNMVNVERKPDSSYAKVNIQRGTLSAKYITNRPTKELLTLNANAYIENKAHFKLQLSFNYSKPQFRFDGRVEKFNLQELNPLTLAYTPAKINNGMLDEITISGIAERTKADGTLKFLYHDLQIDLELHKQAKWKSFVIAFAANSILNSSNPVSLHSPPRIVQFHVTRDMNKGFINLVMKSLLNGLKETMIMSKVNRKAFHDAKKKLHQQTKK